MLSLLGNARTSLTTLELLLYFYYQIGVGTSPPLPYFLE